MAPTVLERWPQTDDELWWWLRAYLGVTIPRVKVCPDHKAPFQAFADAYFARYPVTVWKASRGFGGKSMTLGILSVTEAITLGAQISVLGGSASQSLRVHEHTHNAWWYKNAPRSMLAADPNRYATRLKNGGWIVALAASQKSARGPHPQRLRLDEIDEMDLSIFEAAQGQPMDDRGLKAQTVASSTHQYPDKTMTAILQRAHDNGWPVYEWCWRESVGTEKSPGWLSMEMVERKRIEVSASMWDIEYDLQEPSVEGRAIDPNKVDIAYDSTRVYDGLLDEKLYFEKPDKSATYVTGVDWAKEQDYTIIRTWRTDVRPWQEVAFLRTGRKPWPLMVADVNTRLRQYGGDLIHDITGIGNVVNDFLDIPRGCKVEGVIMAGREREILFSEYIAGIEAEEIRSPRILFAYDEHKYVTLKDLYKGHPPDSLVAGALAWKARTNKKAPLVLPGSISRPSSPWRS